MPKQCQITGKKTSTGYNVSHSKRQTKITIKPNLQKKRLVNPATGEVITVKLTTAALKTLNKWQKAGRKFDLRKLLQN